MKTTVIYYSETKNTKKIAEYIFANLKCQNKEFINLDNDYQLNDSDLYIICFPIINQNCRMKVIECFEQISNSKVIFVATCGLNPSEKYKDKLDDTLLVWLEESNEYLGMKLIQCKTSDAQKEVFYNQNTKYAEQLKEMFDRSENHPDEDDLNEVNTFVQNIINNESNKNMS